MHDGAKRRAEEGWGEGEEYDGRRLFQQRGKGSKDTGKGGKGAQQTPKGRSKGKGDDKGGKVHVQPTVEHLHEVVALHNSVILRLDNAKRQHDREHQFVLAIEPGTSLSKAIQAAQQQWRDARPSRGPHPAGEQHHMLWIALVDNVTKQHINDEVRACLLSTVQAPIAGQPLSTSVVLFTSLGRPNPTTITRWLLKFEDSTQKGREIHEQFMDLVEQGALNISTQGIAITRDRGPVDSICRQLRNIQF